jgi:hypothetical protein
MLNRTHVCILILCICGPRETISMVIKYTPLTVGHAVAQLVEALLYKPERRGFDFRWCHWNFSLT